MQSFDWNLCKIPFKRRYLQQVYIKKKCSKEMQNLPCLLELQTEMKMIDRLMNE